MPEKGFPHSKMYQNVGNDSVRKYLSLSGKECKIAGHSLMAPGKVGSTAAFVFPVADGSVPVDCRHMPVECTLGPDVDVKAVPSGDFKKHFRRYFLTVQEFPLVLVKLLLPAGFLQFPVFLFFPFLLQTFLFLSFCMRLTGLYQRRGVEAEGFEYTDGQKLDITAFFNILNDIGNPVSA